MPLLATDHHGKTHEVFWGEIAPCEHMVQIYEHESVFLDALEGYVAAGLRAGEGVVVVATSARIQNLETRLTSSGLDLPTARRADRYIPLDAEATLAKFMVGDWPDDQRFEQVVSDLLTRAGRNGRRVRAFGEMVALLWDGGHNGATVRLEHLWHRLCQDKGFSLFCAYPRVGFTKSADASIKEICAAHSTIIHN